MRVMKVVRVNNGDEGGAGCEGGESGYGSHLHAYKFLNAFYYEKRHVKFLNSIFLLFYPDGGQGDKCCTYLTG